MTGGFYLIKGIGFSQSVVGAFSYILELCFPNFLQQIVWEGKEDPVDMLLGPIWNSPFH